MQSGDCYHEVSTTSEDAQMDKVNWLKASLTDWREFVLVARPILVWEKTYFAYCIAATVTALFLCWWLLDLTVISTLALLLFIASTADYVLPSFGPKLRGGESWGGLQEEQYDHVCYELVEAYDKVVSCWQYILVKKATQPKTYMASVTGVLFLVGLIGFSINNTFLLYVTLLAMCMFPGAYTKGYLQTGYGNMCKKIQTLMKMKPKDQ